MIETSLLLIVLLIGSAYGVPDLYDLFDIGHDATNVQIDKAYKALVVANYPDRLPESEREEATKMMKKINNAKSILSNSALRSQYDEALNYGKKLPDDFTIYEDSADIKKKNKLRKAREEFIQRSDPEHVQANARKQILYTAAAGFAIIAATTIVQSVISLMKHGFSNPCANLLKTITSRVGSADIPCSTSIKQCKLYYENLYHQSKNTCSRMDATKPMNAYIYQILQRDADIMLTKISTANSLQELEIPMQYAADVQAVESDPSLFRKSLSSKITQAIQARKIELSNL